MFTGLVECVGTVRRVMPDPSAAGVVRVEICAPEIASEIAIGDSVAVSGVCLTAVGVSGGSFTAQMMEETMRVTKLGALSPGSRVNLERALRSGGRMDGHIVQGHVDEVGVVERVESLAGSAGSKRIFVSTSGEHAWGIAPKGSICVDGVSLTVIESGERYFSIGIIPLTMRETTIGSLGSGDPVNIEIDVIARYIANVLRYNKENASSHGSDGLTWEKLAEYGWS